MIYRLIVFQLFMCFFYVFLLFHCFWIRRKREINNEWVHFTWTNISIIGIINKSIFDRFLMDVHKLISTFISISTNYIIIILKEKKNVFISLHTIFVSSIDIVVAIFSFYCFGITSFRFESTILCDKILYAIIPLETETCNQQVRRNTFIINKVLESVCLI